MDLVVCDRPNDNHMGTLFLPSLSCHLLTSVHTFIPLNPSIFYLSVSLPLLPAPPFSTAAPIYSLISGKNLSGFPQSVRLPGTFCSFLTYQEC